MSAVRDCELRPQFVASVRELRGKVTHGIRRKSFRGRPCSPAMFIELCQHFCESINRGGLPEIGSSWELVCKAESARLQQRCLEEFRICLARFEALPPAELDLKAFERESRAQAEQLLRFFEQNALGDVGERKKEIRARMDEEVARLNRRFSLARTEAMEERIGRLNVALEGQINAGAVGIFEIVEQYDRALEEEGRTANGETLGFVYRLCFEGLKASAYCFFGNFEQARSHEHSLLSEKLGHYQNSFSRMRSDQERRTEESDRRERELRQNVLQLEIKVRQNLQELEQARSQLQQLLAPPS